jgi:hypothetical protein
MFIIEQSKVNAPPKRLDAGLPLPASFVPSDAAKHGCSVFSFKSVLPVLASRCFPKIAAHVVELIAVSMIYQHSWVGARHHCTMQSHGHTAPPINRRFPDNVSILIELPSKAPHRFRNVFVNKESSSAGRF